MGLDKARIYTIANNSNKAELKAMILDCTSKVSDAIDLIVQYGGIDGAHHKDWVLDQVVRKLAGDDYERIVAEACDGEDGPNTYGWDVGIAP